MICLSGQSWRRLASSDGYEQVAKSAFTLSWVGGSRSSL